jgi:hypothetical protein
MTFVLRECAYSTDGQTFLGSARLPDPSVGYIRIFFFLLFFFSSHHIHLNSITNTQPHQHSKLKSINMSDSMYALPRQASTSAIQTNTLQAQGSRRASPREDHSRLSKVYYRQDRRERHRSNRQGSRCRPTWCAIPLPFLHSPSPLTLSIILTTPYRQREIYHPKARRLHPLQRRQRPKRRRLPPRLRQGHSRKCCQHCL